MERGLLNRVTLKQLEIFRSVVVSGSITKAARRTGLSQPSISQQLAKLEEFLGAQLIHRNRSGQVDLTAAGEFWFKSASDLLWRYDAAIESHAARFSEDAAQVRLGTTPTLRGRFVGTAARITLDVDPNARFEQVWGLNSGEIVERLRMHQLNFALVNKTSLEQEHTSYKITPMFRDTIAWVVPAEIPTDALRAALKGDAEAFQTYPALGRYVALFGDAPLQPGSDDWYRHYLPTASTVFGGMTYSVAVDLTSEGLSTAHCPLSLYPNLPQSQVRKLRWFGIEWLSREVVMAMPKHLMSIPAYAEILGRLQSFAEEDYALEMVPDNYQPFTDLLD
ncbi:transcriptional regulator, LysR family protein [Oceanicola granulosus HTCC2516]|uniref:Transcriptional regulator, LysR family protein n=1 Tax=Oceanicola granulosus (strain ATCC BAA-861 / DSM 15982 / KCTC 12143 / HTCC2516) TaxID=314256 RepID=Q2CI87_OCEGH|nr:transcriptional regulator, LysR family protein [Oceanicola granulosus HTCC2516]